MTCSHLLLAASKPFRHARGNGRDCLEVGGVGGDVLVLGNVEADKAAPREADVGYWARW
jgi:hypothetical protein